MFSWSRRVLTRAGQKESSVAELPAESLSEEEVSPILAEEDAEFLSSQAGENGTEGEEYLDYDLLMRKLEREERRTAQDLNVL